MDDSHACIDAIRDACVIRLPRNHRCYQALLGLFTPGLKQQGAGTFADIEFGQYDALLPVPYWDWIDHADDAASILARDRSSEELKYGWPLLKDVLRDCQCVFSGTELAIAPHIAPLELFGSYAKAPHRLFMSATVTNDAFLVKGLGLDPQTITNPLVYTGETWSGEKMILLPSLLHRSLDRENIIAEFTRPSPKRKYGVVALTPSFTRAQEWVDKGGKLAQKDTIYQDVERLKNGYCEQPLVIANRYDGIDLPDEACRILILDSLPFAEDLIGRLTESSRPGSELVLTRIARTVEQGLGRAVRGERDYCVVLIIGPDLVNALRTKKTRDFSSPQTRTQIEIGLGVTELAKEDIDGSNPLAALKGVMRQCLRRDEDWKEFYRSKMDKVTVTLADPKALQVFTAERNAEIQLQQGKPEEAAATIQSLIDRYITDPAEKGWYLQEQSLSPETAGRNEGHGHLTHAPEADRAHDCMDAGIRKRRGTSSECRSDAEPLAFRSQSRSIRGRRGRTRHRVGF